jgi:hypothetical protein
VRRSLAVLAGALVLAGCPIPQAVPDYPAGTITPPRILTESLTIQEPIVFVPAGCSSVEPGPGYDLGARLFDSDNIEQVQARWFVNYPDREDYFIQTTIPADPDTFERTVPIFRFHPYGFAPPGQVGPEPHNVAGTIRVVELLVSNRFWDPPQDAPIPFRSPAPNFETQLQRWTFLLVVAGDGDPSCPPP